MRRNIPQDAQDAEDLMRFADLAAFTSKTKAKSNIQFYCHDLKEASRKRIELEAALRDAIKGEQFELFSAAHAGSEKRSDY